MASTDRVPASTFFMVSAFFHYLGPAFAVLLFARVDLLGVAWLRIASAALVFAVWRRPWRTWLASSWPQRCLLIGLGVVLAAMNSVFYWPLTCCRWARLARSSSWGRLRWPRLDCARPGMWPRW